MCGIVGVYAFDKTLNFASSLESATSCLRKRGPDAENVFIDRVVGLGHTRLSIIDTSSLGHQPMTDSSGRFTIVYNGEFFNYKEHRSALLEQGVQLTSHSDTEVLLQLYMREGAACLSKINGFFAFAIYDKQEESIFIARDRYGIKPLYHTCNEKVFVFASEIKAIRKFQVGTNLNEDALLAYLQLNYVPGPFSMLKEVVSLAPGHYLKLDNAGKLVKERYYTIKKEEVLVSGPTDIYRNCFSLLEDAVERRLVSDVPLGAFLSGGVDSSIIVGLASQKVKRLKTFSIGFPENAFYDETRYAELVAKKFNTEHQTFKLSYEDLLANLPAFLENLDEPFADSSALAVFVLSKYTSGHVKVALSGDGADELFAGYNKHRAERYIRSNPALTAMLCGLGGITKVLPASRNGFFGNRIRQLQRFAEVARLSRSERYWRLCSYCSEKEAQALLKNSHSKEEYFKLKTHYLEHIADSKEINDVLNADMDLVLQNDMLVKVDRMSMANGLEVRTPFLDYTLVDYITSIPAKYKIDGKHGKLILRNAFAHLLPKEVLNRGKQGFEIPLVHWLRNDLQSMVSKFLSKDFIEQQGIFEYEKVSMLRQQLYSYRPGDSPSRIWGLIIFQHWWKKLATEAHAPNT